MQDLRYIMGGSFVVVHGFSSSGMWASEHVVSVVVALRLSCSEAYGILLPQPGIEPASPALQGRFLTTGSPGKSLKIDFIEFFHVNRRTGIDIMFLLACRIQPRAFGSVSGLRY